MEHRFLLGIAILVVVLALTIGTAFSMKAIHAPGETALAEAASLALAGKMEQAVSLAMGAYDRWQKYQDFTAAFADHSPMDDTERLFREMAVYAQSGEVPHFAACCTQLSAMLKAIYETHGFSLRNIL
jgi:hypothetical protein